MGELAVATLERAGYSEVVPVIGPSEGLRKGFLQKPFSPSALVQKVQEAARPRAA